jgi:hypothetical protein
MERREPQEEPQGLPAQEEKSIETTEAINRYVESFRVRYQDVLKGDKRYEDLYSGDFVNREGASELILGSFNGSLLTVEYADLFDRFVEIVEKDVLDEKPMVESFDREPEPRTDHLRSFKKMYPGEKMYDLQTTRKLRTTEENTVLLLSLDRYFWKEEPGVPFAETWTLRKMKFDKPSDPSGDSHGNAKIKPRSMVRTQSLPALTSGK